MTVPVAETVLRWWLVVQLRFNFSSTGIDYLLKVKVTVSDVTVSHIHVDLFIMNLGRSAWTNVCAYDR